MCLLFSFYSEKPDIDKYLCKMDLEVKANVLSAKVGGKFKCQIVVLNNSKDK